MKKLFLVSILSVFCVSVAAASDMLPAGGYYETRTDNCDMVAMHDTLDRATADRRAVITVVKCAPWATAPHAVAASRAYAPAPVAEYGAVCTNCAAPIEVVTDRRVYVEETVQTYAPVVHYVPAGTYTRTRRACNACDM